jgi:hypothetical protein
MTPVAVLEHRHNGKANGGTPHSAGTATTT